MLSPSIEQLIKIFAKFPTVGPKTASRFAFYLMQKPQEEINDLIKAIQELKNKVKTCSLCYRAFENETAEFCSICSNPVRNKALLCVVEKEIDLETIEKTSAFKGLYFILAGTLGFKQQEQQKKFLEERVDKLCTCIKSQPEIKEVILALNPTTEGQNTALWLKRKLEPLDVKITQLAKGMPLGGELEYADEETISSALEGRK